MPLHPASPARQHTGLLQPSLGSVKDCGCSTCSYHRPSQSDPACTSQEERGLGHLCHDSFSLGSTWAQNGRAVGRAHVPAAASSGSGSAGGTQGSSTWPWWHLGHPWHSLRNTTLDGYILKKKIGHAFSSFQTDRK